MRIITRAELKAHGFAYSNKHLLQLEREGMFPRRVRLGGGRNVGWVAEEIEAYTKALIAKRDATQPKAA
jgi:prophage regulatory protein